MHRAGLVRGEPNPARTPGYAENTDCQVRVRSALKVCCGITVCEGWTAPAFYDSRRESSLV